MGGKKGKFWRRKGGIRRWILMEERRKRSLVEKELVRRYGDGKGEWERNTCSARGLKY